jgi:hypothetical protein
MGAYGLVDLLQQFVGVATKSTFSNKLSGESFRNRHFHKPWFDADYRTTKRELRLWLKANPDLHVAKHQESKLKILLKRKTFFWETIRAQHMCALAKVDAFSFWKKYRPRALVVDKINAVTLLEGFHKLVGQSSPPIRLRTNHLAQMTKLPPSHTLNTHITLADLLHVLKKLQRNKVVGLDGMKAKFIFDAGELLHMPLLIAFNCFLVEGFLEALSTRVVHTLFKGGNASEFDNYGGITIGPILAKLFIMILDKR